MGQWATRAQGSAEESSSGAAAQKLSGLAMLARSGLCHGNGGVQPEQRRG